VGLCVHGELTLVIAPDIPPAFYHPTGPDYLILSFFRVAWFFLFPGYFSLMYFGHPCDPAPTLFFRFNTMLPLLCRREFNATPVSSIRIVASDRAAETINTVPL